MPRRLLILVVLAALAGCGDDSSSEDGGSTSKPADTSTRPEATSKSADATASLPFADVEDFTIDYYKKATQQEIAFCPKPRWGDEKASSNEKDAAAVARIAFKAESARLFFCSDGLLGVSYVVYESPAAAKRQLPEVKTPYLVDGNTLVTISQPPATYLDALKEECGCGELGRQPPPAR